MSIELLKKLVRLANNNPNDHEANLAARKACKMIAENDFSLLSNTVEKLQDQYTVRRPQTTSRPRNPAQDFYEDFIRRARANPFYTEPHKQQYREGSWDTGSSSSSKQEPPPKNPYNPFDPDKDFEEGDVRTLNCRVCKKLKDTQFAGKASEFICKECISKSNPQPEPPKHHPSDHKYYERRKEKGFGSIPMLRKCKTCGQQKMTLFMGLPELFECNSCQWTAFERDKPK